MKVRVFGILLLIAIGVLPIAVAGYIMIVRANRTALEEVRTGNQRVADRAAIELRQFVAARVALVSALAAPLTRSALATPEQARRVLRNYRILFPTIRSLDVVGLGAGCREALTSRLEATLRDRCAEPAVHHALMGQPFLGPIALNAEFAPMMTVAVPLELAGTQIGAAVAEIDMLAIWETVKQVRVG